jgi:adenylate cyclase
MAFWNAPVDVADHPRKAVRAALAMRETLARLNDKDAFGFGAGQKVAIGIGIHTGLACVGNMGAETHFNYSAVGDPVNVAARIESACKEVGFDILVSETTAKLAGGCAVLEAGALGLKGKSMRTRLFAIVGDERLAASGEFTELQNIHWRLIEALRTRSTESRRALGAAKLTASALAPGLSDFYRRISRRGDHFVNEPTAKDAVAE